MLSSSHCKERKLCEGLKSLPLGEEGTTVLFLHRALISSIDQLKTIGDIGVFFVFIVSLSVCSQFSLFSVDISL
jgi:hypothetical protein